MKQMHQRGPAAFALFWGGGLLGGGGDIALCLALYLSQ